jgi:epoxyqueuosine reductase
VSVDGHETFRSRARRRYAYFEIRSEHALGPLVSRLLWRHGLARLIIKAPSLPALFRRRYQSHRGAWPSSVAEAPEQLRTVKGAWRDPAGERAADARTPLHDWNKGNAKGIAWTQVFLWRSVMPVLPRLSRAKRKLDAANALSPDVHTRQRGDAGRLTADLKALGASLGLSALGVARYDEKYEYVEYREERVGDRVIVCVLEQNYKATQSIPSPRGEQAVFSSYAELMEMSGKLIEFLNESGYRAIGHSPEGHNVVIYYGVEAGLGQLGLNGQLLTPQAGSRCRLVTIETDAPLEFDKPVDYGIHTVCDSCKACVRRCPPHAIPGRREWKRGVLKAKIDPARCAPIVGQVAGCGICMKVCPIQKYGLAAVIEEFQRSGEVLGRQSDDLEGFDWPLDGLHYGPGELPQIPPNVARPPGISFEPYPQEVAESSGAPFL